jgi:hypothetical protein
MLEAKSSAMEEMRARQPAMKAAHEKANREALLEHARMGRSVCQSRDGKVVWIPPAEIFARYGLDEFGRPLPTEPT